jgi:hypothetical protein
VLGASYIAMSLLPQALAPLLTATLTTLDTTNPASRADFEERLALAMGLAVVCGLTMFAQVHIFPKACTCTHSHTLTERFICNWLQLQGIWDVALQLLMLPTVLRTLMLVWRLFTVPLAYTRACGWLGTRYDSSSLATIGPKVTVVNP